jgi:NAD(P)-dependent dehydrogenase (short-subunit alcohol dehydrogenase family)
MAELENKVAIVTGAASGIGRSTALALAREGARIVVSDVDETGGQETVRLIEEQYGGQAIFVKTDVSDPGAVKALVDKAVETYGRLDVMVNNAGIGGEAALLADYSLESWDRVIGINLSGVFYGMKYAIPAMLESGGGSIINVASILGQVGFATAPAYVAAKHGIVGLTKNAALEYSAQGVRVNAVGPGFIHTPMIEGLEEDEATNQMLISMHPIGRLGRPEEVAELIVWLASEKASFVTGAYYPVDGGYLAR